MEKIFNKNGGELIQNKIDAAVKEGTNCAVVNGNWEIEKTIKIPSNFHLVLEDCHLKMADNTVCNMFTNEHCRTEIGHTLAGQDHDIVLEGRGNAILDGGNHNGVYQTNSKLYEWMPNPVLNGEKPHVTNNHTILFTNITRFTVKNISIHNHRFWAMNFIYCTYGKIQNIDFRANYYTFDKDTKELFPFSSVRDITGESNRCVRVPNADGVNIRTGCHDIMIENITGYTEDDTVAISPNDIQLKAYTVSDAQRDVYNIVVRNVNSSALCSNVRIFNQTNDKLYNIFVDGVFDSSAESPYMDRGYCGVRVGDRTQYGTEKSPSENTYNIKIKNVYSRACTVIRLIGAMRNVTYENVNGYDDNICFSDIETLED